MEWTQELCFELINKYRKKEILWNPRDSNFYNKLKKEDAWAEIGASLEKNVEGIKRKMDSLKGSYRREKTREKKSYVTGNARNDIYKSKWFAYEALQFLDDKDEPRETISNLESLSNVSENLSWEEEENETEDAVPGSSKEATVSGSEIYGEPSIEETPNKIFRSPPKKRSKKAKMSKEDEKIEQAFSFLQQMTDATKPSKDRCTIFGEYVAEKLRAFDKRRIAIAEQRINNVLFELEMSTMPLSHPEAMLHSFIPSQCTQSSIPVQYSQLATPTPYSQPPTQAQYIQPFSGAIHTAAYYIAILPTTHTSAIHSTMYSSAKNTIPSTTTQYDQLTVPIQHTQPPTPTASSSVSSNEGRLFFSHFSDSSSNC